MNAQGIKTVTKAETVLLLNKIRDKNSTKLSAK